MLSSIKLCSFTALTLLIQNNLFAADLQELQKEENVAQVLLQRKSKPRRFMFGGQKQAGANFAATSKEKLTESRENICVTDRDKGKEPEYDPRITSQRYMKHVADYHQIIEQIVRKTVITVKDIPEIDSVVSKAVRDVCNEKSPSLTVIKSPNKIEQHRFSPYKVVQQPKIMTLTTLKRLLDHLAFCREQECGESKLVQTYLQSTLQMASMALGSCKDYPSDFQISSTIESRNPFTKTSSVTTPNLIAARKNSASQGEMPCQTRLFAGGSANPVEKIVYNNGECESYGKSCKDNAKFAEEENKRFAGINEKWISLFSARHKHHLNLHVPAIILDAERQRSFATSVGFNSLLGVTRKELKQIVETIPVDAVQKYFVFALLFNLSDSHLDNIRVDKNSFDQYYLISIDHAEAMQVFYERPGTASLRLGQFLALFSRQSEGPMHDGIRTFLKNLDPKAEVEFMRTHLTGDVEKLTERVKDEKIKSYFNRKLDHFRLNLEFLKALASIDDATFSDAFELRRGQFTLRIFKSPHYIRLMRVERNHFIKESLVQHAIAIIHNTNDESQWQEQLSKELPRQTEPSCPHLLTEKDKEEIAKQGESDERTFPIDSRLDDEFFDSFSEMVTRVLLPRVREASYHRMTAAELNAYKSIGF